MYDVTALARLGFLFVGQSTQLSEIFEAEPRSPYYAKATASPSKHYWRVTIIAKVGSGIINSFEPPPRSAAASAASIKPGVGRQLGADQGTQHSSSSGNLPSRIAKLAEDRLAGALYRRSIANYGAAKSPAAKLAADLSYFRTFKTTLY